MPSHRHDRAAGTLRREISRIISEEVRDPDAASVRVSSVTLSPDKRSVKVFVAPAVPEPDAARDPAPLRALERAAPFIRKTLTASLRMRRAPDLNFAYDLGEQNAQRVDVLLKRIKKRSRKGLAALVALAALPLGTARAQGALERLESSVQCMGSEFRIACYAPSKRLAAGAVTAAFEEVRRVDALLSHYKPESELSSVNRQAVRRHVAISDELSDLLARCLRYSEASEGAFDVTVGALVDAWGFYTGEGTRPNWWTLWRARYNSGYRHLDLDQPLRVVRFMRSGLRLDPGAIGKGYAVDRAVDVLREFGIQRALVSAGTSSIYALGAPPESPEGWTLDLRAATAGGGTAGTVVLKDQAISTSGSYEKYFESGGERFGHILDPRTGRPVAGLAAVSVVTPHAIDSEAWATALFVNGEDWARQHPIPESRVLICPEKSPCRWLDENY